MRVQGEVGGRWRGQTRHNGAGLSTCDPRRSIHRCGKKIGTRQVLHAARCLCVFLLDFSLFRVTEEERDPIGGGGISKRLPPLNTTYQPHLPSLSTHQQQSFRRSTYLRYRPKPAACSLQLA